MNYIKHLNGFFERLSGDERMTAYHISLYLALFQQWNLNRFSQQFQVSRTELMWLSRIRSANTYARCMKQLHLWGYITYFSLGNWHTGSRVSCTRFDTGDAIANRTSTDAGAGTLFKKRINRKGNQPMPFDASPDERKKEINGKNPYYVSRDKDYSEPL